MAGFRSASSILANRRSGDLAAAEHRLEARLGVPTQLPTRVHEVALEVLEELVQLGVNMSDSTGGEAPAQMRILMRMIAETRPLMAKNIAKMPASEIRKFMGMLAGKIQQIVDAPDGGPTHASAPADPNGTITDRASA